MCGGWSTPTGEPTKRPDQLSDLLCLWVQRKTNDEHDRMHNKDAPPKPEYKIITHFST